MVYKIILSSFFIFVSTVFSVSLEDAVKNIENKKYDLAIEQLTTLALQENHNAQYNLALLNYNGTGVEKNLELAFFGMNNQLLLEMLTLKII